MAPETTDEEDSREAKPALMTPLRNDNDDLAMLKPKSYNCYKTFICVVDYSKYLFEIQTGYHVKLYKRDC